jgi:O-antigen ligase
VTPHVAAGALAPEREWWRSEPPRLGPEAARSAGGAAQSSSFPYRVLIAFLFILLLAPQAWFPVLAPLRPALLAAAAGVTAHVLDRFFRRQAVTLVTHEVVIAALLGAWALLTVPFSAWPGGSLAFLLESFLKSLAIFWLIANLLDSRERFRGLTLALVIAAVPLGLVAVVHFASGVLTAGSAGSGVQKIAGYDAPLTQNPNDLALTLNLFLPFAAAHFLGARRGLARVALGGCLLLSAAAVILTYSRAGFLTLAAIALLSFWKLFKMGRGTWLVAPILLLLLTLPLLPGSYLRQIATIADISSDQSGSAQARWEGMVTAAKLAVENPLLGAGAGMDVLALNEAGGPTWKEVHNVYLQYAVDLGLPGLGLFLWLFACCLFAARRVQREAAAAPGEEEMVRYGAALEISLVAFAVAAMFHPVGYHFYFYILAGLAVALRSIQRWEASPVTH